MTVSSGRSFSAVARPSTDDDNLRPYSVDVESDSTLSLSISEGTLLCTSSGALRRWIRRTSEIHANRKTPTKMLTETIAGRKSFNIVCSLVLLYCLPLVVVLTSGPLQEMKILSERANSNSAASAVMVACLKIPSRS